MFDSRLSWSRDEQADRTIRVEEIRMSFESVAERDGCTFQLPRPIPRFVGLIAVTGALVGCEMGKAEEEQAEEAHDELLETARTLFGTLEPAPDETLQEQDVVLGRALFWDERLSYDGRTSCASCHTAETWGSDARSPSIDARGEPTSRQSQTVFNATRQPALRWLADREDAASQAHGSITGSMGFSDAQDIVPLLLEHGYEEAFHEAFPEDDEPVSPENYGRALQAYQSTLKTPAPFDAYLAGDTDALDQEQREGLDLFVSTGCAGCHSGTLLGGERIERFGIAEEYWVATGSEPIDPGRYAVTGEDGDRYLFRTPMLRNVAKTAPYFHDGTVASLHEAVEIMARVQLNRSLSAEDLDRIVAFLESLSGEVPPNYSEPGG